MASFKEQDEGLVGVPQFDDFLTEPSDLQLGPVIGEGQFGSVHIGKYFGDIVAVKTQKRSTVQIDAYILRELSVLKFCRHENLLEYIGACNMLADSDRESEQFHTLYIVTEYAQGGELHSLLKSGQPLGLKFLCRIALGCLDALSYLHDNKIIHRDIKSENILLDGNWSPKLSDFGMARAVRDKVAHAMTICGTDLYMSPELLFDEEYTFSADMFPFGLVLFEMMARKVAGQDNFCERKPSKNFTMDYDEVRTHLPVGELPVELVDMATLCTDYEPTDRPLARDATSWMEDIIAKMEEDTLDPPEPPEVPPLDDSKLTSLVKEEKEASLAPCINTQLTREFSERVILEKAKSIKFGSAR